MLSINYKPFIDDNISQFVILNEVKNFFSLARSLRQAQGRLFGPSATLRASFLSLQDDSFAVTLGLRFLFTHSPEDLIYCADSDHKNYSGEQYHRHQQRL